MTIDEGRGQIFPYPLGRYGKELSGGSEAKGRKGARTHLLTIGTSRARGANGTGQTLGREKEEVRAAGRVGQKLGSHTQ